MNLNLQPIHRRHLLPFSGDASLDSSGEQLFEAVSLFYAGDFDTASDILAALRSKDPQDIRPAFFDAMIPFLNSYFFETGSGSHTTAFEEKVKRFPVMRAKAGDLLARLLVSGVYGYASLHAIKRSQPFEAGTYGLEGWSYLRKVTTEDITGFSLIGRGLMAFLAGSAPFPVRLTFTAQGIEANREKGILMLEKAAQSDTVVSADAVLILSQLYPLIQEHAKAVLCARALCTVYPENAVYRKVLNDLKG
jgi:hypothetical protein